MRYEYYQWIALTLLAQAVFFYLPGWLWSYWEKGHIEEVVGDNGVKVLDDILDKSEGRCKEISEDIASKLVDNMGSHKKWAAKFIFCEVLNFCTTVLQILFTHKFLNEGFLDYGVKVFEYALDPSKENPMDKVSTLDNCKMTDYLSFRYFQSRPDVLSGSMALRTGFQKPTSSASSPPISGTRSSTSSSPSGGPS